MTGCKWDSEAGDYLRDGDPCRRDEYGDPTHHCTARRTCSQHVGPRDQSCPRCVGRVRQDLRWITEHAPLLDPAALEAGYSNTRGFTSTALVLASPAADPSIYEARRALDRLWLYRNIPDQNLERAMRALLNDPDDEEDWHPVTILGSWHRLLAADYGHDQPTRNDVHIHAAYLDRILNLVAQDPQQEFRKIRKEIGKVRSKMAVALSIAKFTEKGYPCPICVDERNINPEKVRLKHEHGHWCTEPECEQIHYIDSSGDRWVCPRNRAHVWTEKAYRDYIEERTA